MLGSMGKLQVFSTGKQFKTRNEDLCAWVYLGGKGGSVDIHATKDKAANRERNDLLWGRTWRLVLCLSSYGDLPRSMLIASTPIFSFDLYIATKICHLHGCIAICHPGTLV